MAEQQRNPNLMNPKAMQAVAGTRGTGENVLLFSEILTKVNNAKDKPKKIAVLRQYDNAPLRQVLKGAFDKNIVWDLPAGDPPYIANEAPIGTEHGLLRNEAKRFVSLIDALYDNRKRVFISAEGQPEEIYKKGDSQFEFKRCVSRLHEMRSKEYL